MIHLTPEQQAEVLTWGSGAEAELARQAVKLIDVFAVERDAWRHVFERERRRRLMNDRPVQGPK